MNRSRETQTTLRRHRMEEIWETFGLPGRVDEEGNSHLPLSAAENWTLEGASLGTDGLLASLEAAALPARAEGETLVIQTSQGDWATTVDRLHQWLIGLYEENPATFLERSVRSVNIPASDALPESTQWLERYYGGELNFMPREKKPMVADLRRSSGAYLVSIDDQPLAIMDAMSQIATLAGGFQPPEFQKALDEGHMDGLMAEANWNGPDSLAERRRFEAEVSQHLPAALCHFAYANSGAEANEKAYLQARLFGSGGKRILAFEGSFHGRTLLSLYSTWNKVKREPYQIRGYEVEFIPFPGFKGGKQPPIDAEWIRFWREGGTGECPGAGTDPLMDREIACLGALRDSLAQGDLCAVNLEPMQSEGGDNYGSARFFNGIRALTRHFNTPLIMDEVQTGFGLGGTFFWHQQFQFQDENGVPDYPELVICAKKAQVGVTISVWPDAYPTPCQGASAIRGRLHAEMGQRDHRSCEIHGLAEWGLASLEDELPKGLVTGGRCSGYAFAFDLPTAAIADGVVAQRFYRGAMVYKAGSHTLRYRLSQAFSDDEVHQVFRVIRESLEAIIEWAGGVGQGGEDLFDRMSAVSVPKWEGGETPSRTHSTGNEGLEIRVLGVEEFDALAPAIEAIEERSYEPERRDSLEDLRGIVAQAEGFALGAFLEDTLVGFTFAGPLEHFAHVQGPNDDAHLHRRNTLYSADVTVDPDYRGRGLGKALKAAQIQNALQARNSKGEPRYRFITGRNRLGHTPAMAGINGAFGAYAVATYSGQYGASGGVATYYRIPLRRMMRKAHSPSAVPGYDLKDGILQPLSSADPGLLAAIGRGVFDPGMLSKMTLSNFTTRSVIRYVELLQDIRPKATDHMYLASCRDETTDKSIRTLRSYRPEGEVCISFEGAYHGHTTAASRSLSDWSESGIPERMGWFEWPTIPHPGGSFSDVSDQFESVWVEGPGREALQSMDALNAWLEAHSDWGPALRHALESEGRSLCALVNAVETHGADRCIGVFAEWVQERTGATASERYWKGFGSLLAGYDVPVVMDETSTGFGRSGRGMWRSDSAPFQPDVITCFAGGQLGHVFVSDRYFLAKPLQLISTWDGDEVSAVRMGYFIQWLMDAGDDFQAQAFEKAIHSAAEGMNVAVDGEGFFVSLSVDPGRTDAFLTSLRSAGVVAGKGLHGRVLLSPGLSGWTASDIATIGEAIRDSLEKHAA